MLQSLSNEMLKLKSATEHYEETKENLQNMCASIDKISVTHQKLTDNIGQFMVELGKMNLSDEIRKQTEKILQQNEGQAKVLCDEVREQTDRLLQHYENQSKALRQVKYLALLGTLMGAVAIVLTFLF